MLQKFPKKQHQPKKLISLTKPIDFLNELDYIIDKPSQGDTNGHIVRKIFKELKDGYRRTFA